MKKHIFVINIFLVLAMLLTACGKEPNIVCGNCATSVSGDSFYCPNCGTAFFQNVSETTAPSTEGDATEGTSTEPTASEDTTNPIPQETTHVHSFSAATCLTPSICVCGATSGDLSSHLYQDFVCLYCGEVDSEHAYEYLSSFVTSYGIWKDSTYRIDSTEGDTLYSLVYDTIDNCTYITIYLRSDGEAFFSCLWLDDYSYMTTFAEVSLEGTLNPCEFNGYSPIPVSRFSGENDELDAYMVATQSAIGNILTWLDRYLFIEGLGITIEDLGFTAY